MTASKALKSRSFKAIPE